MVGYVGCVRIVGRLRERQRPVDKLGHVSEFTGPGRLLIVGHQHRGRSRLVTPGLVCVAGTAVAECSS